MNNLNKENKHWLYKTQHSLQKYIYHTFFTVLFVSVFTYFSTYVLCRRTERICIKRRVTCYSGHVQYVQPCLYIFNRFLYLYSVSYNLGLWYAWYTCHLPGVCSKYYRFVLHFFVAIYTIYCPLSIAVNNFILNYVVDEIQTTWNVDD